MHRQASREGRVATDYGQQTRVYLVDIQACSLSPFLPAPSAQQPKQKPDYLMNTSCTSKPSAHILFTTGFLNRWDYKVRDRKQPDFFGACSTMYLITIPVQSQIYWIYLFQTWPAVGTMSSKVSPSCNDVERMDMNLLSPRVGAALNRVDASQLCSQASTCPSIHGDQMRQCLHSICVQAHLGVFNMGGLEMAHCSVDSSHRACGGRDYIFIIPKTLALSFVLDLCWILRWCHRSLITIPM